MADTLAELHRKIDRLPVDVTEALRAVAWRTSRRVMERATQILNSKTGGKADRIASISVVEEAAEKQFLVVAEGAAGKPANLALWFERGTVHMEAKPFMRPAGDAEDERYRMEGLAAAVRVAEKLGQ